MPISINSINASIQGFICHSLALQHHIKKEEEKGGGTKQNGGTKKKCRTEIPNKPQWPAADNANCLSVALSLSLALALAGTFLWLSLSLCICICNCGFRFGFLFANECMWVWVGVFLLHVKYLKYLQTTLECIHSLYFWVRGQHCERDSARERRKRQESL